MHQLFMAEKPRFMAIAAEFDLWPPQIMALQRLEPGRPIAMSELASLLGCDNSNVTGIVDRLEDRGLVERRSADHDRRLKMVHVTDAGMDLRRRLMARLYDQAPRPLAALSPEDQRTLRDLLARALGA
jgi:DNA-binding MarR family transcriptional regulator